MISCIILAAGSSQRFGSPKALAQILRQTTETAIERLQQTCLNSKIDEIIIVLGDHRTDIEPFVLKHPRIKTAINNEFARGQTSSFQVGLKMISSGAQGIMLFPVDTPIVKAQTINVLIEHFRKEIPQILIPMYQNKKGHPPIFHSKLKNDLLKLPDSIGLNEFQSARQSEISYVSVDDPGILRGFNTPEELEQIKKFHGS